MEEHKANREYKASVFADLFGKPDKMLELYNTFYGANCPPDTRVVDATLKDVLFMDRVNDLAFVVEDKVVILIEHQSTINENMPLRFLEYVGRVYEKLVDSKQLYLYDMVKIPTPEFIVLYNGKSDIPDRAVLKLSDAFKTSQKPVEGYPLELEVKIYNVNIGHNADLIKRSVTLDGYVIFIDKVNRNVAAGIKLKKAITLAIRECIKENTLADYLQENGSEVFNMLIQEWRWDKALDSRYTEGVKKGIEKGIEKDKKETAQSMLSDGLSIDFISKHTKLSHDSIREIRKLSSKAASVE